MGYYTGDIPAHDQLVEPARGGEEIDLSPFTGVIATLRDDTGTIVSGVALTGTIDHDEQTVAIQWPTNSPFATAGIYYIGIVLTSSTKRERIEPVPIVVEDEYTGWLSLEGARLKWADAPRLDIVLYEVLWTSKQQVIAYAPALVMASVVPLNYRTAQLMQGRNIWNAAKVAPDSGGFGEGTFVIRPFPLDWMVKQQLRPATAVRRIG